MAVRRQSDNTKIIINEVDLTKPGGAGIAPSDIAFVPGFSVNPDAPENIPTLCEDVYTFEKLFGKKPRILTSNDVRNYEQYGFIPGSFDPSYVYAKELLYLGMPVIYSNIVNKQDVAHPEGSVQFYSEEGGESNFTSEKRFHIQEDSYSDHDGKVVVEVYLDGPITTTDHNVYVGDETIRFTQKIDIPGSSSNVPGKEIAEISVKLVDCPHATITHTSITTQATQDAAWPEGLSYVTLSNNQIEFTNQSMNTATVSILFDVTINFDLVYDPHNHAASNTTLIFTTPSPCLNVFYDDIEEDNISDYGDHIKYQLDMIADKSIYSVKYITSGGYPSFVNYVTTNDEGDDVSSVRDMFASAMIQTASHRGDAVALIDYQRNETEKPFDNDDENSFYSRMHLALSGLEASCATEFGAMMYPWGQFSCGSTLGSVAEADTVDMYLPGSFAYMRCLAKAIKTSPNWLAMAGVTRGVVPGLKMLMTPYNVLSNTVAEEMQPKFGIDGHKYSINCVTNIRPYGLTVWGNRTLKSVDRNGCVALNFLNTRNMLSDIKKILYSTAKSLMFEQNSDTLWLRFKAGITPLLNQLKSGNGISDYKIVRGTTKYNGDPLQKGELAAVVKIYPIYAVEYFELTVELNDEEVEVY